MKVDNHLRISKYKIFFGKVYMSNLSQDDFGVTKLKNAVPWMHVISDVNDEQIVDMFYEKRKKKKFKRI